MRLLESLPGFIEAEPATREAIELVHSAGYAQEIESIDAETWLDGDTYAGTTTWEAALLAAGCAIRAF